MVRRLIGYDRYSSKEALAQLNRVYLLVRHYVNFFQPVMQLQHKSRHGARVHRVYDTARTPYRGLLEPGVLAAGTARHSGSEVSKAQSGASVGPDQPGLGATLGHGNYYIQQ